MEDVGGIVEETFMSWVVLGAAFIAQTMSIGVFYSFGTLYVGILRQYNMNETDAAWIGSLGYAVCLMGGLAISKLCERLGCRTVMMFGGGLSGLGFMLSSLVKTGHLLFATYSIIASLGMSCLYFTSVLVLPLYFNRRMLLANGIVTSGGGIGCLTLSVFLEYSIHKFGLSTTFQFLAALSSVTIFGGITMRRTSRRKRAPISLKTFVDKELLSNKAYLLMCGSICIVFLGYYVPYVHMVNMAQTQGISSAKASLIMGIMTISSIVANLIFGKMASYKWVNRMYVYQLALLGMGVSLTLGPLCLSYTQFVICAVAFGLSSGCFVTYVFPVTSDVVSKRQANVAFGMTYTSCSLFSLAGPPLAGALYTSTGSYQAAFTVSGGAFAVASVLLFLVPFLLPHTIVSEENVEKQNDLIPDIKTPVKSPQSAYSDSGFGSNSSSKRYALTSLSAHTECQTKTELYSRSIREQFLQTYSNFSRKTNFRGSLLFIPEDFTNDLEMSSDLVYEGSTAV